MNTAIDDITFAYDRWARNPRMTPPGARRAGRRPTLSERERACNHARHPRQDDQHEHQGLVALAVDPGERAVPRGVAGDDRDEAGAEGPPLHVMTSGGEHRSEHDR